MASVVTVLVCVALPVVISYRYNVTGANERAPAAQTARNLHWRRRLQHGCCGVAITSGYKWVITDAWTAAALLSLACAIFLAVHRLRRRLKSVDKQFLRLFGPLLRTHEIRGELPSAFWFLAGSAGAVALFSRDIALQSILHLAVGDPIASVVGITMGDRNRVMPKGKSLAGSLAAFLVCSLSTLLLFGCCCHTIDEKANSFPGGDSDDFPTSTFFGPFNACDATGWGVGGGGDHLMLLLWFSFLGGVSGAVGEFVPLGVDDNLSMPIVSGVIFFVLSKFTVGGSGLSLWGVQT